MPAKIRAWNLSERVIVVKKLARVRFLGCVFERTQGGRDRMKTGREEGLSVCVWGAGVYE